MNGLTHKIYLVLFILLILGFLGLGSFLTIKKTSVKKFFAKSLPGLLTPGSVNSPGKLFGPNRSNRATAIQADKIIEWTNFYRVQEGLPPLAKNETLSRAATTKVQDMFQNQYFEHVSPVGTTPGELVLASGYDYKFAGENLALGDFKDEKDLVDAWMASPGHRANILNKDFSEIGVFSDLDQFETRAQTWLSVQEFGTPAPNCTKPSTTLADTLNNKKTQYKDMAEEMNRLADEATQLAQEANVKIQEGNDLYQQTHDRKKADVLWREGESLRTQAEANLAKAKSNEAKLQNLYDDINSLVVQYNRQVNLYNECIK